MDEQQQTDAERVAPQPATRSPQPDLFPLDALEIFALIRGEFRGKSYTLTHVFRQPGEAGWRGYWGRSEHSMTAGRGERVQTVFDSTEANEWLWNEFIVRVEGYGELPGNWRELIPLSHKTSAVKGIAQVFPSEDEVSEAAEGESFPLTKLGVDNTSVVLEAGRNGVSYPRLVHYFATPSSEHEKRWSRLVSTTYRVSGGRRGEVREEFPDINAPLIEMYDQLIQSVEGYQPGEPKSMDPLHKVIAVGALLGNFRPAPVKQGAR